MEIPRCHVDGKKIIRLKNQSHFTKEDLISCLVNFEDVAMYLRLAKLMFKGEGGKNRATIFIQKHMRRYLAMQKFKRIKVLITHVIVILLQRKFNDL